jgi:nucleoside-diphosphate-sugar epimerase
MKKIDLSFNKMEANTARFVYDALTATFISIIFIGYEYLFNEGVIYQFIFLPFVFIIANTFLGIYGRNKRKNGKIKSLILLISIIITGIFGSLMGMPDLAIILWALFLTTPIILPRIILGMVHGSHRDLLSKVNKGKGPILVIGGAGYIGSYIVEILLEQGKYVRVLDKLMYGDDSIRSFKSNPLFELIVGDATDISLLAFAMREASSVIHLAGLVGDPACAVDADFTRHTNIVATRMIKSMAQTMGVERFIFSSSCSVYGVSDKEVTEAAALNPVSLYAKTKIDSEIELLSSRPDNFCVTILRFATVFGHSRRPRFDLVANLFVAQACQEGRFKVMGSGQWRPFIHVMDLARAVVLVLNSPSKVVDGQIFNVGSKELNMTIGMLGEKIKTICKQEAIPVDVTTDDNIEDPRNYAVSFDKIKNELGFMALETMESGIKKIIDLFKEGYYGSYSDQKYSNLITTKLAVEEFRDPKNLDSIYSPLAERMRVAVK